MLGEMIVVSSVVTWIAVALKLVKGFSTSISAGREGQLKLRSCERLVKISRPAAR